MTTPNYFIDNIINRLKKIEQESYKNDILNIKHHLDKEENWYFTPDKLYIFSILPTVTIDETDLSIIVKNHLITYKIDINKILFDRVSFDFRVRIKL